jgi:hypothetical protein
MTQPLVLYRLIIKKKLFFKGKRAGRRREFDIVLHLTPKRGIARLST